MTNFLLFNRNSPRKNNTDVNRYRNQEYQQSTTVKNPFLPFLMNLLYSFRYLASVLIEIVYSHPIASSFVIMIPPLLYQFIPYVGPVLQVIIFITLWLFFLYAIFYTLGYLLSYKLQLSAVIAGILSVCFTSLILFELVVQLENAWEQRTAECSSIYRLSAMPEYCHSSHFLFVWQVNWFSVLIGVFQHALLSVATMSARVFGTYISVLYNHLPWMVFYPALLLSFLLLIVVVLAAFRYEFSTFFFRITPSKPQIQDINRLRFVDNGPGRQAVQGPQEVQRRPFQPQPRNQHLQQHRHVPKSQKQAIQYQPIRTPR